MIRSRSYLRADREKGRFRSFLLGALEHLVAHRREYERAQTRGGDAVFVSMSEAELVEAEETRSTVDGTPEQLYEREWAAALLRRSNERLEQEWAIAGTSNLFQHLKPHFAADCATDYQTLSRSLGRPVTTLRSDMGRLRARYRAILRQEVAVTVQQVSDVMTNCDTSFVS